MELTKIVGLTARIGLASMLIGCASKPIKAVAPTQTIPIVYSVEEQKLVKRLDSYKNGTILWTSNEYWIKDNDGTWTRHMDCERDDSIESMYVDGRLPDALLAATKSAKVYPNGLPKNHPCYKDPEEIEEEVLEAR